MSVKSFQRLQDTEEHEAKVAKVPVAVERSEAVEDHPRFGVVVGIPVFNEEKTIASVVLRAQKHADVVVVCDDGSSDLTAEIAEKLGADLLRHDSNLGYGAALKSLFRRARELGADVLVTLDGDGQHHPAEIPAMAEIILDGKADVAVGSRFLSEKGVGNAEIPWYRRVGIKTITRLSNAASNHKLRDAQSGFRAYGRKALETLKPGENGMGVSVELLVEADKNGLTVVETPVRCTYNGLDKTSTQNSLRHGTSVIVSVGRLLVEDRPLLFLGVPGVISLLVGIVFGIWMLQIYAVAHHIVTNIALASIAFVLLGFFCLTTATTLYSIRKLAERLQKNSK